MKKLFMLLSGLAALPILSQGQDSGEPAPCRCSEMVQQYYTHHPEAANEQSENELFTQQYLDALQNAKGTAVDTYRIAIVFHVYGTIQGGQSVNNAVIQEAVDNLNKDFHGLNNDYNQVHSQFMPLRSTKNIKFYLAKKDPDGNPTTGIVYYPAKSGYGNGVGYDSQVAADAWDNYRYVNIYVQHDLYNDGIVYNSGVAWYPSTSMSNNKLARIVYNGAYLASNSSDPEFSSVLTHEFGHFLNLIHTFEGGCNMPNDNVADTPPCDQAEGCHSSTTNMFPLNCNNQLVNSDNYMDYNICYKMFTQGQANRMDAALQLPSRKSLWQDSTLISTGIYNPSAVRNTTVIKPAFRIHPNPGHGKISIETGITERIAYTVLITDIAGRIVTEQIIISSGGKINFDLQNEPAGIYLVQISDNENQAVLKLELL
jgi:hypothetical protein